MDAPPPRFTADLAAFFTRHPLCETGLYSADGIAEGTPIPVHFYAHDERLVQLGISFETVGPKSRCQESDTADATHDSVIVIRGVSYHVARTKPSNAGTMWLELSQEAQHG